MFIAGGFKIETYTTAAPLSSKTCNISLKPHFARSRHHDVSICASFDEDTLCFFLARFCMFTFYQNTMERRLIFQHSLFSGHNYITITVKPTHDSYCICSKHGSRDRACESTKNWFSHLGRSEQRFLSSLTAPSQTGSMSLGWLLGIIKILFGVEDFP